MKHFNEPQSEDGSTIPEPPRLLSPLYERDETAWLEQMSELIPLGELEKLDYLHLGEYLGDMARRDRREVRQRLAVYLRQLLCWIHDPKRRTRSKRGKILREQFEIEMLLESAVLRRHAEAMLQHIYDNAAQIAAIATGQFRDSFPAQCPYTIEQIVSDDLTSEEQMLSPANPSQ